MAEWEKGMVASSTPHIGIIINDPKHTVTKRDEDGKKRYLQEHGDSFNEQIQQMKLRQAKAKKATETITPLAPTQAIDQEIIPQEISQEI